MAWSTLLRPPQIIDTVFSPSGFGGTDTCRAYKSTPNHEAASPTMEVYASETALVFPSRPPFEHDHILPLSHLDTDRNLHVTFRYLRAYTSTAAGNHPSDPFRVISAALSDALVYYYPFTGSLRRRSDDRLELFCAAGKAVPFVRASADCSLESVNYLDEPDRHFVEQLVPNTGPEEGLATPFVLQLTVFACGGYCLGAAIHHAMCDGLGATQFFNAVAELARGASRISVEPVWERGSLLGPRERPRVEVPFEEVLCFEKGSSPYGESSEAVVRECFHVRDGCLDRYKALLLEKSGVSFTTFEALGAFLWRARFVNVAFLLCDYAIPAPTSYSELLKLMPLPHRDWRKFSLIS